MFSILRKKRISILSHIYCVVYKRFPFGRVCNFTTVIIFTVSCTYHILTCPGHNQPHPKTCLTWSLRYCCPVYQWCRQCNNTVVLPVVCGLNFGEIQISTAGDKDMWMILENEFFSRPLEPLISCSFPKIK